VSSPRRDANALRRGWVAPTLLSATYGTTCLLALAHHLTEDSTKYVKDALVGGPELFHPHHLFYSGVMALAARLAGAGWDDLERSFRVMQVVNVATSTAAVVVFYRICRQIGAGRGAGLLFTLLFGLASAFFQFTSQVEVYNATTLFLCLAVLGMAMPEDHPHRRLLVGAGYFFAMGFHQVGVFLGVAILIDEALRPTGGRRGWRMAWSVVPPLAAIGACYAGVGLWLGHRTPGAFWNWLTMYAHLDTWGKGGWNAVTLYHLAVGAGKAVVDTTHLPNGIAVLVASGLAIAAVVHLPTVPRSGSRLRLLIALLGWLVSYGFFMAWWDAANVEAWIVASVPLFLILALLGMEDSANALPVWRRRVAWGSLATCLGLIVFADITYLRYDRRPDRVKQAALLFRRETSPGDLVIALDTQKAAYYELYLYGRDVKVEALGLEIAKDAAKDSGPTTFTQAIVSELIRRVQTVQARNGRCFVDPWIESGEIDPILHLRDIDPREFARRFDRTFLLQPLAPGAQATAYAIGGVREGSGTP
jgi:hypothetical protein